MENNKKQGRFYTMGEEIFNAVTHGAGTLLAIAGCAVLLVFAALYGDVWAVVGSAIYGASLIVLYVMSTLYHSLTNPVAKRVFRVFDHCTIFILIAGTYTPITFVTLRGTLGWTVFGVSWGIALLGIVLNAVNLERFKWFSLISYIGMGWTIVFILKPLMAAMAAGGLTLLFLGGVFYTGGIVFYLLKKKKYMHSVWHLFVLAGSVCHYFCILLYVLPMTY